MAEYIEREALIKKMFPYNAADKRRYAINAAAVEKAIKEAPAAKVLEVAKGVWVQRKDERHGIYHACSICKCAWATIEGMNPVYNMRFCPNCGSKMDGERSTENAE